MSQPILAVSFVSVTRGACANRVGTLFSAGPTNRERIGSRSGLAWPMQTVHKAGPGLLRLRIWA